MNIATRFIQLATKAISGIILLWFSGGDAFSQVSQPPPAANQGDAAQIMKDLGPLADGLVVAFSMDGPENGSAVVLSPSIAAKSFPKFEGPVQWVNDAGRQCANFSQNGALLRTNCSLGVAPYTIAVWMKFPLPNGSSHAIIVDGSNGPILAVKSGSFVVDSEYVVRTHGIPDGWHHVALTSVGPKFTVFLDGSLHGSVSRNGVDQEITVIKGVGSTAGPKSIPARCGCLDDMFVYMRALTPPEIVALSKVRLPVQPAAGDLAPGSPQAVADVKTYVNNLILVHGPNGPSGGGFIARLTNGNYLFTKAKVMANAKDLSSIKTLAGAPVRLGAVSLAVGGDTLVAQVTSASNGIEVMQDIGKEASVGDAVIVFVPNGSTGGVDTLPGRIVFISAAQVTVDTGFAHTIFGSPVIHLKTGKVIGYSPASGGDRLDAVKSWQTVNWDSFNSQAVKLEQLQKLSRDLQILINVARNPQGYLPGDSPFKQALQVYRATALRPNVSQSDLALARAELARSVKIICQADIASAQRYFTYDFFQRQLGQIEEGRSVLSKAFETTLSERP